MAAAELRLLGPVEAWADGRRIDVGPRKQRLVLAVLALEVNRSVEVERLVDLAWPEAAPRTASHAIRVCVSGLRSAFGTVSGLEIQTRGSGYALVTDPMHIDVHRFRVLLAQSREVGDDAQRVALLDRALQLWSSSALLGTAPPETQRRLCAGLEEARLGALEDRLDARLRLGHHHELLDELTGLVAEHPLRERLAGLLMLALYRAGQAGDALDVLRRCRQHLADQLGLDPGVALRQLELAILRNDPAVLAPVPAGTTGPVPAQLPLAVAGFAGRVDAMGELDALLAAPSRSTVAAITGTAGVGKTALVVHWAHQHRHRFPDGQLYVNLGGYAPGPPTPPGRALAGFLRALGVPAERIPLDVVEASALYRSLLADRRMLVVLDNAIGPDQVRPLLPGGPGCLTLATSRDGLAGLTVQEGARALRLDVLPAEEAHSLLGKLLGERRIATEPGAAAELAELCGFLPLALRIAAAHLTRHPRQPVADLAAALRGGNRLAMLAIDGDEQSAVRAAFDLSYGTLKPEARRMFRLLGVHPGADLSTPAAAALAAIDGERPGHLLAELAGAHLVDEHVPGRFSMHDLLRLYARSRVADEDSEAERESAITRLCDFYLRTADAAARLLYPQMQRLSVPADLAMPAGEGIRFTDHASGLAWLEAERPNLVAIVDHAAGHGPRRTAWLLADALRGYFWMRRHAGDWLAVGHAALAAAEAEGELQGAAAAHLSLAQAERWLARYPAAIDHLVRARTLANRADWRQGEAAALGSLANVYRDQGRLAEAADHHRQAGDIYRETGGLGGEAVSLGNLGNVLLDSGRVPESIDRLSQGLAIYCRIGASNGQAHLLNSLGCAYLYQGQLATARNRLEQALALHRQTGSREGEADTLNNLAELHRDAGRYDEAKRLAQTGLTLAREAADQRVEVDAGNTLGSLHRHLGDPVAAMRRHQEALRLAREAGYGQGEAVALIGLAEAEAGLSRQTQARSTVEAGLAVTRRTGLRILEGHAGTALATIALATGDTVEAVRIANEALAIHRETGHRLGQARSLLVLARAATGGQEPARRYAQLALAISADIGAPEAGQARTLLSAYRE